MFRNIFRACFIRIIQIIKKTFVQRTNAKVFPLNMLNLTLPQYSLSKPVEIYTHLVSGHEDIATSGYEN